MNSYTLTPHQTRLVKATIPALRDKGEAITALFYRRMLADHPELNNLFNSANQANHRQPRALTHVFLAFAGAINHDMSELIPKLERMCNKHCSLGIRPEHYAVVPRYLIGAFRDVLGGDDAASEPMSAETEEAWTKAYWLLAKLLMGRERQIYASFGAWAGWRPFRIARKEHETADIVSLYLTPQDGRPLPAFLPGQYVSVQASIPHVGYLQSRQFSLSDAPHERYYRITVKAERGSSSSSSSSSPSRPAGTMSSFLVDALGAGDAVDVTHPAGAFWLDVAEWARAPAVLISAGVGVAPMVAMLNAVAARQPLRDLSWVHGARAEVPFGAHVRAVARAGALPNLRTNVFKTHLADGDLAGVTHDYDVRVDLAKVAPSDLFLGHAATEYYLCGPEQFMVEMADYLKMQGVPVGRLRFELFSTGDMVEVK